MLYNYNNMSEKIEVFKYPVQYRVIANVAPLIIVFASIGVAAVAWQNLRTAGWVTEAGQPVTPSVFYLTVVIAILLANFFAICIHLTYPTIFKNKDGFRLVTQIYASRWFTWDEIATVGLPPSQLVTQIYTIGVKGLHPLYWAIGLSRGMISPGFLLHPRMIDGGKLLRVIKKHRPELFEE